MTAQTPTSDRVRKALATTRSAFVAVGFFSAMVNLLMLTGPLFMLQVYDRVLAARSVPTLMALLVLVIMLYGFMGLIDFVRTRVLVRIGHRFDEQIGRSAFIAQIALPLKYGPRAATMEPVRDVDQLRQFFGGAGVLALFDLPWMPLYLTLVFMIHPAMGMLAVVGAVVLFLVAFVTDRIARPAVKEASALGAQRNALIEQGKRNVEVLHGMGMLENVAALFDKSNDKYLQANATTADTIGASSTITKVVRLFLQSAIYAVGAYLAIYQIITPGAMIAASIIIAKALQPVEQAVQHWRGFLSAQQSYRRLNSTLEATEPEQKVKLPAPHSEIAVDITALIPPGTQAVTLSEVRFGLKAGSALGVIGATGSGKSTLVRAIVGVWKPARGNVLLDRAPLDQYDRRDFGRYIGYLPQDIELFEGTVAQNIARFDPAADDEAVVAAAQKAGVHELIVGFPNGYNTMIGIGGAVLSAGQRQRVALARALYGDPFLLVLDEPNANLDGAGEAALMRAMVGVRERGGIVIIVAHRPSALQACDQVLVMEGGRLSQFGPRDEVLNALMKRQKVDVLRQPNARPRPAVVASGDAAEEIEALPAPAAVSATA